MSRALLGPVAPSLLLAVAFAVAPLRAQSVRPTHVAGAIYDANGKPVADAQVAFVADAEPDVPAVRELVPPRAAVTASCDARGVFRVPASTPGLLLATTASGLGGFVERCWPGRAVRLTLQPMAEVARADGAAFELFAAHVDANGDRRHLPALHGDAVRLPAGRYETWIAGPDGHRWLQLALLPGERRLLPVPTDEPVVVLPALTTASPRGFPHRLLTPTGAGIVLRGDAARASLFVTGADGDLWHVSAAAIAPIAADDRLHVAVAGPTPTSLWLLEGTARGTTRVLARAESRDGRAILPLPRRSGDLYVLATAPGAAAVARSLLEVTRDHAIATAAGRTVPCRITAADGEPLAGAAVTFAALRGGPVTAVAYTDELGRAELGPIAGAGEVCVDDPHHCSATTPIAADFAQTLTIRLEAGLTVRGRCEFGPGEPAVGVAVTLRDSRGRLPPGERTVQTDHNGDFAFAGLAPTDSLVLFASCTRDGRTFSAKLRTRSGAADLRMMLRDEDPQLLPPAGR